MKKLFVISAAFFLASGLLLLAYNIAKDSDGSPENKKEQLSKDKSNSPINKISEEKSYGFFVDRKNEKIVYYTLEEGKVMETDLDGRNKKIITNESITGIEKIFWSPSGKESILKTEKGFLYHDIYKGKTVELDKGTDSVTWSNDGTKIIYKYYDYSSGAKSINISDPNGENWQKVIDTELVDVKLAPIPGTQDITFWSVPSATKDASLHVVSIVSKNEKELDPSRKAGDYKWSYDGKKAIVSFIKDDSGKAMSTAIMDAYGVSRELGVPTIASKIAWSLDNRTCYLAIPGIPQDSIMPDDYESEKIYTTDTFWRVNTESGERSRLVDLSSIENEIDAYGIEVVPGDKGLLFINRRDGFIYRLDF